MTAFESIKQGLTEAIAFADGKNTKALVHIVDVPVVDVAAIRASTPNCPGVRSIPVIDRAKSAKTASWARLR